MRAKPLFVIVTSFTLVVAACLAVPSCTTVKCGEGTHDLNGTCVNSSTQLCGPGTLSKGGQCVPVSSIDDAGVAIGPCGRDTEWDPELLQCVGIGGGTPDGGARTEGIRWTDFELSKPEAIAGIAHLQLPGFFHDGTIVILLRSEQTAPGVLVLQGGSGLRVTDAPLTYTFTESFRTTPVVATLTGSAFQTTTAFDWDFPFIPGQPALYIFKASLSGTIDADGLPSSTTPPMSGKYSGCFLADSSDPATPGAKQVYIEILFQDLKTLLDNNFAVIDADCNNSGSNNGYAFEGTWQGTDVTKLVPPTADGGGV